MSELLSPAGTVDAFNAAINNGANAIYLGLDKFSARAYAENFSIDNLKGLVQYAHLRNVKIYVTINTIIYDFELDEAYKCVDELAFINVDAIIVQDLAIFNYIVSNYQSIKAHVSTQMGIDDIEGAKLISNLGASRIVFARETPLSTLKEIKEKLGIEIEAFIHGALCVSYSGNCLMSSFLGERSGNRGRCAGCCRKPYTLINLDKNEEINKSYILSMKDLNTSENLSQMSFIDSLKIEGRMKEPNYVATVTKLYRDLLDDKNVDKSLFTKIFNRTYTKGFINNETSKDITNIEKPNNFGFPIGEVIKANKNKVLIKLASCLHKGDQIRIESSNIFKEISIPVTKIFNSRGLDVESSFDYASVYCDEWVEIGAKVYKTKDSVFLNDLNAKNTSNSYNRPEISMDFKAQLGCPITLKISYKNHKICVKSDFDVELAKNNPTTRENVINQLSKINDTPYKLSSLNIEMDENLFIPLKQLNELRRKVIEELNNERLKFSLIKGEPRRIVPSNFELKNQLITVEVSNQNQYDFVKSLGLDNIYFENIVRRNNANYKVIEEDEILAGGLGAISYYKGKNKIVSDSSLNIVNHKSVAILSSLGVSRITLSNEISKDNIEKLISNYKEKYLTDPDLELIVYGRTKLMHSKYCPLKRLNKCGECKHNNFALKDDYSSFPILFNDDCTTTILNDKTLNLIDEIPSLKNIHAFRLVFTTETNDQIENIIKIANDKLNNISKDKCFNQKTDTHGHFYKNPL